MSDVKVQISTHRIIFTPEGGDDVVLVDVGDCVNAPPELVLEPKAQAHELIGRDYVEHYCRGNAEPQLVFDVYRKYMSRREAQAAPLRLWRALACGAHGALRFQTGFAGAVSGPAIDWVFKATLSSYRPEALTLETSPFEEAIGVHAEYEFIVTEPEDAAGAAKTKDERQD